MKKKLLHVAALAVLLPYSTMVLAHGEHSTLTLAHVVDHLNIFVITVVTLFLLYKLGKSVFILNKSKQ